VRLKTRWSDWEADGPGPYSFRAVMGTLILGLKQAGLISGPLHRDRYNQLMQACYQAITDHDAFWAMIPEKIRDGRTAHERDLDEEVSRLFHHLWTQAGSTHYEKEEWKRMEGLLRRLGWGG